MRKHPIGFMCACLFLCTLFFGCSATGRANTAVRKQFANPFVQRTVTDDLGKPHLRITCEYVGRQPYEGYQTHAPWKTK